MPSGIRCHSNYLVTFNYWWLRPENESNVHSTVSTKVKISLYLNLIFMFPGSPGTNWRKQPPANDGPNVTVEYDYDSMQMEFFVDDPEEVNEEMGSQSSPSGLFLDHENDLPLENHPPNQVISPEEPTSAQKKKRIVPARDNVKKKKLSPSIWKKSVRKANFNAGIEHVTSRGKTKPARQIGKACDPKCNRCARRLTREEEEEVFQGFWDLENIQRKREEENLFDFP